MTKFFTMLRSLMLAGVISLTIPLAQAQDNWPSKPITFVIPYAAGGFADTRMRLIAQELSKELNTTIVVENKAGAGGVIGTAHIARAKPDGYTIGSGHLAPLAVNPALTPQTVSYKVKTDLTPIALVEEAPLILNVNKSLGILSVHDLIEFAKQNPGAITFGSSGVGGAHHLSGVLFANEAGIDISHIPYKGGAPAATDLMAGHIAMMFEMGYAAIPAIESGKVRPLAVTSAERLTLLPDVPTLAESGLPGFESYNWQGVIAPAGIHKDVVVKLNEAINRVLKKPEVVQAFDATGGQIRIGTPEEFGEFIDNETKKWAAVIEKANITAN